MQAGRHYYVPSLEAVTTALNDAKKDYADDLEIEDFISASRKRIRLDAVLQGRPAEITIEEPQAMPVVLEDPEVVKDGGCARNEDPGLHKFDLDKALAAAGWTRQWSPPSA